MKIGYARISTDDQNLGLQLDALQADGCGRVFQDTASGATSNRPCRNLRAKSADLESVLFQLVASRSAGLPRNWGSRWVPGILLLFSDRGWRRGVDFEAGENRRRG